MKKILRLKQRGRIAASFALLFVFFVILGLFSTSGIERITRSFRSMYEDRLIPSMDISEMLALLYENRVSVENHITTRDSIELIQYEQAVYRNHKKLDSLINKLSLTYLVPQEKQDLQQFTAALLKFRELEEKMLLKSRNGQTEEALLELTHSGDVLFHNAIRPLQKLELDQKIVGEQLYVESLEIARIQKITAYSITFAAVIVGLILAFALTFASIDVD